MINMPRITINKVLAVLLAIVVVVAILPKITGIDVSLVDVLVLYVTVDKVVKMWYDKDEKEEDSKACERR